MRILLASVCILLASATAGAQEAVHLENLEKARVGAASLVAADEPVREGEPAPELDADAEPDEGRTYTIVGGEITSGSRHFGSFRPPYLIASPRVELGAFLRPGVSADLDSRVFFHTPDGDDETVDISGRHHFRGELHQSVGNLHGNLSFALGLAHATDGERGLRDLEVAPAAYRRLTVTPTMWITSGESVDEDRWGAAFDYTLDDRAYLDDGPASAYRSHRVGLGFGFRGDERGTRGWVRFVDLGYAYAEAVDQARSLLSAHRLDASLMRARIHFGGRSSVDEEGFTRATLGMALGWSFLWREAGAGYVHTPNMGADIAYEDHEVGRVGLAVNHRPGWSPDGTTALAMTQIEAEGRLASDEVPVGMALAGTIGRVERLPFSDRPALWHARADLELFGRLDDVEIGPRGSLGHGLPSGSMGWSFDAAPLTWFGTVGGFARLALR